MDIGSNKNKTFFSLQPTATYGICFLDYKFKCITVVNRKHMEGAEFLDNLGPFFLLS
jgi:hypothetical protein